MYQNDNHRDADTYAVIDLEFLFDREAHARYMDREEEGANPKIRWPFRHVVAAAAMIIRTVGEEGGRKLEVERFRTFGRPEMSECEILQALFDLMWDYPDATLMTWGGDFADVAILRAGALTHGLRLPPQLHPRTGRRPQAHPGHIDLSNVIREKSVPCHMTEVAARLGIPCKTGLKAHEVGLAAERGRWSQVKEQAEIDVIAAALILGRLLFSIGKIDGSAWSADAEIGYAVLRSHSYRDYGTSIKAWLEARGDQTLQRAYAEQLANARPLVA